MPRFVLALVTVALSVYAIADCASTPASRMNHLSKPVWLLLVIVLPIAGPIAWLVLGKNGAEPRARTRRGAAGGRGGFSGRAGGGLFRAGVSGPVRPARPAAPDDDAEFLAQLERDIRRERIHRERAERQRQAQPGEREGGAPANQSEAAPETPDPSARPESSESPDSPADPPETPLKE